MHTPSTYTQDTNISEDDHDDGMTEWLDDWFEITEHASSHE